MGLEQFDDRRDAGRVLARLSKVLELALDTVKLSLPQYRVLGWLELGEQASARLAEYLAVTPPSVTAIVDGLVHRGLVVRMADPNDRRRQPLHLTEAGRATLVDADAAIAGKLQALLGLVDAEQAQAAMAGLSAWLGALEEARASIAGAAR